MFSTILFIVSEGILYFNSSNASSKSLPKFTSLITFLNSLESAESIFLVVTSSAVFIFLPASNDKTKISKKDNESFSNSFSLLFIFGSIIL